MQILKESKEVIERIYNEEHMTFKSLKESLYSNALSLSVVSIVHLQSGITSKKKFFLK